MLPESESVGKYKPLNVRKIQKKKANMDMATNISPNKSYTIFGEVNPKCQAAKNPAYVVIKDKTPFALYSGTLPFAVTGPKCFFPGKYNCNNASNAAYESKCTIASFVGHGSMSIKYPLNDFFEILATRLEMLPFLFVKTSQIITAKNGVVAINKMIHAALMKAPYLLASPPAPQCCSSAFLFLVFVPKEDATCFFVFSFFFFSFDVADGDFLDVCPAPLARVDDRVARPEDSPPPPPPEPMVVVVIALG